MICLQGEGINNAASQTYLAQLKAGDKVGIRTHGSATYLYGDKSATFSGFKVYNYL